MPKPYLIYNMQTYKELVAKSHDYLKSLDTDKLNQYEKKFVKELLSNKDSLREYSFDRDVIAKMPLLNATDKWRRSTAQFVANRAVAVAG